MLKTPGRGSCIYCNCDPVNELSAKIHIDHVIPLARGSCIDVVNRQLFLRTLRSKEADEALVGSFFRPELNSARRYVSERGAWA